MAMNSGARCQRIKQLRKRNLTVVPDAFGRAWANWQSNKIRRPLPALLRVMDFDLGDIRREDAEESLSTLIVNCTAKRPNVTRNFAAQTRPVRQEWHMRQGHSIARRGKGSLRVKRTIRVRPREPAHAQRVPAIVSHRVSRDRAMIHVIWCITPANCH